MLTPDDVRTQLEQRLETLEREHRRIDEHLSGAPDVLPRLFLTEYEYLRAMLRAEIDWITTLVDDLRSGRMTWDDEWLRSVAEQFTPDDE